MRKLMQGVIALAIALTFAATTSAQAARYELVNADAGVEVTGATGFAIVNVNANGVGQVTVQVRNLNPKTKYWVWGGGSRGSFTTNKKGHGSFHGSWDADQRVRIRTSDNIGFNRVLWNGLNPGQPD